MKFHLNSNIVEGTPEELVKYQELLEGKNKDNQLFCFGHAHQPDEDALKSLVGSLVKVADPYTDSTEISTDEEDVEVEPPTDIQVGDRVKVLKSEFGAEGEATVTAVLKDGEVEVAGTNKQGTYSEGWSNHVSNLEKIEEDAPKGYTFWYIEGSILTDHNVLKTTLGGHFEDSIGRRYTYQSVHALMKPMDREDVREEFEKAKHRGRLLKYYSVQDLFIRE